MIKVKYQDLNNPKFVPIFQSILSNGDLAFSTSYTLRRISAKIDSEMKEMKAVASQIFQKYLEFENEQPKVVDGKLVIKEDASEVDFDMEMNKLMSSEFEINRNPINPEDLSCVTLSAHDLGVIEFLLASEAETEGQCSHCENKQA